MSTSTLLLVFIAVGLLTFAMRFSFIGLSDRVNIPPWLSDGLRFVPPAVLSAIIWPELLLNQGQINLSMSNSHLLAGLIAIASALITKNVFVTLGAGMGALWLLSAVMA